MLYQLIINSIDYINREQCMAIASVFGGCCLREDLGMAILFSLCFVEGNPISSVRARDGS